MSRFLLALLALSLAAGGFALGRLSEAPPATTTPLGENPQAAPHSNSVATRSDPTAAIESALADPDPFVRAERLAGLLSDLDTEASPALRSYLTGGGKILAHVDRNLIARAWARLQPAEAYQFLLVNASRAFRASDACAAMGEWARQDPNAAAAAMDELPTGTIADACRDELIQGWYASGQPGLEDYVRDLGMSTERQSAATSLIRTKIHAEGAEAVVAWAEALPPEPAPYRKTVYRRMATELTRFDPRYGADWWSTHQDEPFEESLRRRVATVWVLRDGPETMEWISTTPAGPSRDESVRSAFRVWRQRDRETVMAWMSGLGRDGIDEWLRPAAGPYSMARSVIDPEDAMAWAELIPYDDKRRIAQLTIARRWRTVDEEAADAWVAQSSLSDAAKEKAKEPLPVRKRRGAPNEGAVPQQLDP